MPARTTVVAAATPLKAQLSPWLTQAFAAEGVDAQRFMDRFVQWKQAGEDESYFFGKDALNLRSKLIRHVHMVPLASPQALAAWDTNWQRRRKRVSDRFLFYVDGARHGYLLLYIVNDPGAHDFLNSANPASRAVRQAMQKMADQFYHFGIVTEGKVDS
jgi:Toxin YafO, type II toxin-antitoxin system